METEDFTDSSVVCLHAPLLIGPKEDLAHRTDRGIMLLTTLCMFGMCARTSSRLGSPRQ